MATQDDLRRLALALAGTIEAPHVDRRAFRVHRIYATLAADGATANLKFTPDEQALKCMVAPAVFTPLDNAWGRQGWTTLTLAAATEADIAAALAMAHAHAVSKPARKR